MRFLCSAVGNTLPPALFPPILMLDSNNVETLLPCLQVEMHFVATWFYIFVLTSKSTVFLLNGWWVYRMQCWENVFFLVVEHCDTMPPFLTAEKHIKYHTNSISYMFTLKKQTDKNTTMEHVGRIFLFVKIVFQCDTRTQHAPNWTVQQSVEELFGIPAQPLQNQ